MVENIFLIIINSKETYHSEVHHFIYEQVHLDLYPVNFLCRGLFTKSTKGSGPDGISR